MLAWSRHSNGTKQGKGRDHLFLSFKATSTLCLFPSIHRVFHHLKHWKYSMWRTILSLFLLLPCTPVYNRSQVDSDGNSHIMQLECLLLPLNVGSLSWHMFREHLCWQSKRGRRSRRADSVRARPRSREKGSGVCWWSCCKVASARQYTWTQMLKTYGR